MRVWIDAGQVTEIAATYRTHAAAVRTAAARLRHDRFGEWGTDPDIAGLGMRFARLSAVLATDLDSYAASTERLGDGLSTASDRLTTTDADATRGYR